MGKGCVRLISVMRTPVSISLGRLHRAVVKTLRAEKGQGGAYGRRVTVLGEEVRRCAERPDRRQTRRDDRRLRVEAGMVSDVLQRGRAFKYGSKPAATDCACGS